MEKHFHYQIRDWLQSHILDHPFVNPFAITMNLKHKLNGISLNSDDCQSAIRHFMNRLNRRLFKGRYDRGKKRLNVIPTYNVGKAQERQHYHLMIDIPKVKSETQISNMVNSCWEKVDKSFSKAYVIRVYSDGWYRYATELKSNKDFIDCNNMFLDGLVPLS